MQTLRSAPRWLCGAFFVLAGVGHFARPEFFTKIVPPYLPRPEALVAISGFFEIVLGIGLFVPKGRKLAAWGLIALLVAVFPANLHMALHPEAFPQIPEYALWLRLPLQGLLIAWAYRYTRHSAE